MISFLIFLLSNFLLIGGRRYKCLLSTLHVANTANTYWKIGILERLIDKERRDLKTKGRNIAGFLVHRVWGELMHHGRPR